MQFKVIAASLLAAAGISAAAPLEARQNTTTCPVAKTGDYVWKISEFSARKPDGKEISSLSFNIKVTNGGIGDFNCSVSADTVEDNKFYLCGEKGSIWFAYESDQSGLILQQSVSDDIQYVGTTTIPSHCRAGGNGIDDFICSGVFESYITLVQYPGLTSPEH